MPRFYFHLHNDLDVIDDEGLELPDLAAAREKAIESAHDIACACIKKGELNLEHYILVTDEAGQEVLKLTFRESFKIVG